MLFDTHAHYDSRQFDADRDQVLSALPGQGVGLVVNPGCDLDSSRRAIGIAERYPFVYAAAGVHPEDCAGWQDTDVDELRSLAAHPKVVAIGEIGLDYYWKENPPREFQQRVFRAQLALARELDLPVIVHDREAHGDCLSIIREFPQVRGVFHCFSGSAEMAKELVGLGWMISFTGALTYKNARKAVEAAQAVPLDRIMIETDSPYMAPVPCRGERCHSGLVRHTCQRLAELRGISPEECARITFENGTEFYQLQELNAGF
ncbi:MAG: TatD family hydrolase [Oscillospiraceae bacterium]|jgi:TatD DNase family protein|nr:TatD family hydrolase [Oscillospiraceae bacterium]